MPERDDGFVAIDTAAEHVFFYTAKNATPTGSALLNWFMAATTSSKKQRFQLLAVNGRMTHIRATQGHSTKTLDPEKLFTRVTEVPEFYYHGTFYNYIEDILYYGLKPGGSDFDSSAEESSRAYTHMSPFLPRDRRCIAGMRKNTPIVLRIDARTASDVLNVDYWQSASGAILTDKLLPG